MANWKPSAKSAVVTPATTDLHAIEQGGVIYKETNAQILGLTHTGPVTTSGVITTTNTTDSTTKDTGSIITDGGIGAEKNIVNGGYIKSGLGRWPTGKMSASSQTLANIWSSLSGIIPNTNDEVKLSGGIRDQGSGYIYFLSYAIRTDASNITIYCMRTNGSRSTIVITNTASGVYDCEFSW